MLPYRFLKTRPLEHCRADIFLANLLQQGIFHQHSKKSKLARHKADEGQAHMVKKIKSSRPETHRLKIIAHHTSQGEPVEVASPAKKNNQ